MIIYHGSTVLVKYPEIRVSDTLLDFGRGFYTTTSYDQAKRWARIKMRRKNKNVGYVTIYEFDYEAAKENTLIRKFDTADMDWLMFVMSNRRKQKVSKFADMHIGPVADDNVYQFIRFFETGVYNAEETIKRLKTEVLHDQWAFHTDKILSYLRFIKYKEIVEELQNRNKTNVRIETENQ